MMPHQTDTRTDPSGERYDRAAILAERRITPPVIVAERLRQRIVAECPEPEAVTAARRRELGSATWGLRRPGTRKAA